ncbi:MAG: ABC transporter ATP-binding protein, partial [Pseudomonadota bacterium]
MNGMRSRQGRRGPAAPGGVAALFWRGRRARALLGLGLALLAAGASAGLLGAAGWLIVGAGMTAEARDDAALAALLAGGAVGAGLAVRILAGVRTIARYAERMTTHDVTFRFLAELRGRLFRALAAQPWDRIERLRKGVALGRLTADVDALDGLYLRLLLPTLTMTGASLALGAALFWWVGPIASAAAVSPLLIALAATRVSAATGRVEARRRAAAIDAVRVRAIDLAAAQPVWAMAGRLEEQRARALDAGARAARAAARLHRSERRAGAWFAIATQGAAAAVFLATALQRDALGALTPLYAAAAALATLALGELATPLRRAALDRGRTHLSDRRLSPLLNAAPDEADEDAHALAPPPIAPRAPALRLSRVAVRRPGGPLSPRLTLAARPGEVVAIRGRSGSGKSSIL